MFLFTRVRMRLYEWVRVQKNGERKREKRHIYNQMEKDLTSRNENDCGHD